MTETKSDKIKYAACLVLTAFTVAFIGWCLETVLTLVFEGQLYDRGFLALPLCPIYGFSLLTMELLFGTPFHGRFSRLMERTKLPKGVRYVLDFIIYLCFAIIVPTLFELGVSVFFDRLFGVRLWYYESYPYNYKGYICLQFSLLWGGAITIAMATVWRWLTLAFGRLNVRTLTVLTAFCAVLITTDFLFNLIYLFVTKNNFMWW